MKIMFTEGPLDEVELMNRTHKVMDDNNVNDFDLTVIESIHSEHGADISAMCIRESIKRDCYQQEFQDELKSAQFIPNSKLNLIIIPTMYYVEHPEVGGDGKLFQLIANRLGIRTTIIPTKSLGSIHENSQIITQHIKKMSPDDQNWIISLSKGTADFKHALLNNLAEEDTNKISGIINMSGMPGGTPMTGKKTGLPVGYHVMKHWLKFRGGDYSLLDEMFSDHPFSQAKFTTPEHFISINIIGVPLLSHLVKPIYKSFIALSEHGPNDGYVLFKDALIQDGYTIAIWGEDHYLRGPEMNMWTEYILNWLCAKGVDDGTS